MTEPTPAQIEAADKAYSEAFRNGLDNFHCAKAALTAAAEVGGRSKLSTLMDEMTDKHIARARTEDRNWQQIIEDRTAAAEVAMHTKDSRKFEADRAAAEVDDEVCITTHLWQSTGSGGSMGKQVRCDHCGKTKYIPW